jgi:hypothetical protein
LLSAKGKNDRDVSYLGLQKCFKWPHTFFCFRPKAYNLTVCIMKVGCKQQPTQTCVPYNCPIFYQESTRQHTALLVILPGNIAFFVRHLPRRSLGIWFLDIVITFGCLFYISALLYCDVEATKLFEDEDNSRQ